MTAKETPKSAYAEYYLSRPCSQNRIWPATYENFTQTEIGGVPIGNLPSYISDKVNSSWGNAQYLNQMAKVTDPLQTVLWTMERAYDVYELSDFQGHEEEKAYLEHIFIRNELLWKEFEKRFEYWAREVCTMSLKEAMDAFEEFRFVSIIDEFFEKCLGRYTVDGIEWVPFLQEIEAFHTRADKLLDEVEDWSAPYLSCGTDDGMESLDEDSEKALGS